MTPVLTATPDQVTELISRARENGTVAMADLNAAFDRCELMHEVIDDVMRMLTEDGVEIITGAMMRQKSRGAVRNLTGFAAPEPQTWSGFTCARSGKCRCSRRRMRLSWPRRSRLACSRLRCCTAAARW